MDSDLLTNTDFLPLWIYVVFVVTNCIYIAYDKKLEPVEKQKSILIQIVWGIFWGWLIYIFCRRGDLGTAWFLLFLPLIVLGIFALSALLVLAAKDRN